MSACAQPVMHHGIKLMHANGKKKRKIVYSVYQLRAYNVWTKETRLKGM